MSFEVGKWYECKDNKQITSGFTIGEKYRVDRINHGGSFLNLCGDNNSKWDIEHIFFNPEPWIMHNGELVRESDHAVKSIETDRNNDLSIIERIERLERKLGL